MKDCFKCKSQKEDSEFGLNQKRPDGLQTYCKECTRQVDRDHYKKHAQRIKHQKRALNKKRYQDNKGKTDKIKSETPCTDCGKLFHPCQMQFDHLKDKKFNVSEILANYTWETIEKEIAKCEVVCANCHCLRTHRRRNRELA